MNLNVVGTWTLGIAAMSIVALTGMTLASAGAGLNSLAFAGLAGIAGVIAATAAVIAVTVRYDRRTTKSSLVRVTPLPVTSHSAGREAA